MSFDEIQREIALDHRSIEENLFTSQRTFQRDIKNIATVYDLVVNEETSPFQIYIITRILERNS